MKTLYLDCSMGAAGDMLTAALLELFPNPDDILYKLNTIGIPHVVYQPMPSTKCGITGTHMRVTVDGCEEGSHHRHHSGLKDIAHIISQLNLSERVKTDALAVYNLIAEAESHVHGVPVEHIHFHEVGALDAVADVAAVCLLMELLAPEQVLCTPIHVGSGEVKCTHGTLPVPAPATAYLLKGIPIYGGSIPGELCTPTGAALLKYFVTRFTEMPVMNTEAIGYGMGKKDFEVANCVRAFWGHTAGTGDTVLELQCNLDDMTPEAIGFAMEQLLASGALEVFTLPAGMKKNRPGTLLTLLCRPVDRDALVRALFRHTTTLGIREHTCQRHTLTRRIETVSTPYGPIRQKVSSGYGVVRKKYEYEDLTRICREKHCSLSEVLTQLDEPS